MEIRTFKGKHFDVQIKRWWRPKDRKAARLAVKFADYNWENGGKEEAHKRLQRHWFFGDPL